MQVEVKGFHKHAHVDRIVDILIKMIGRMSTDYKAIGIKIVIFSSEQIKVKFQFFFIRRCSSQLLFILTNSQSQLRPYSLMATEYL